jgi:N6-adenosine-specific RNA methylase IME4
VSGKYRTIVADPPWPYDLAGTGIFARAPKLDGNPSNAVQDTGYPLMSVGELSALQPPASADAHLYLWTTNSFMVEAHEIARAWGFKPKTILTWAKTHQDDRARISMKTGYYFRGATEHCLFCVRGSLPLQVDEGLPTAYLWPRLAEHSAKPDAFYDLVERASPGPYLEMFARRARLGDWNYWGDQSLGTAEMPTAAA